MNSTHDMQNEIDKELERILDIASQLNHLTNNRQTSIQGQSPVWPWQVPQSPAYTAGSTKEINIL